MNHTTEYNTITTISSSSKEDDDEIENWMYIVISISAFVCLLLFCAIIYYYFFRSRKHKTVPVIVEGIRNISSTLTTHDRENSHVLYLNAPTDSVDPKKQKKYPSSTSISLTALERSNRAIVETNTKSTNFKNKFSTRVENKDKRCISRSIVLESLKHTSL